MHQDFFNLIDNYNNSKEEQSKQIEKEMWSQFGVQRAIMVLDMSGFSLIVQTHGIIHYLGMVRRMQIATAPIVEKYGGKVVKFEADNMYAVFPNTIKAVQSAVAINIGLEAMNTITGDDKDIYVSIGIDFGKVLLIEPRTDEEGIFYTGDIYGDPMNIASKLGEDLASKGEILISDTAFKEMGEDVLKNSQSVYGYNFIPKNFKVSGLELKSWQVEY
jgi:class 3 adenylate cyclase